MREVLGVDWGSTNLRVFRYAGDGTLADVRTSDAGAATLQGAEAFEAALSNIAQDWMRAETTIVVCGMAGAHGAWREAGYLPCPCELSALATAIVAIPSDRRVFIAPGLSFVDAGRKADVMRGEETLVLGAREASTASLFVAPGTHSKWVRLDGLVVREFHTYPSGEMLALLLKHGLVGRLAEGDADDWAAFDRGVDRAFEDSALTNLLFEARASTLLGLIKPSSLHAYLSGLLLGAEVAAGKRQLKASRQEEVCLIASARLVPPYLRALALGGMDNVRHVDGEYAAARGLWRLAGAEQS